MSNKTIDTRQGHWALAKSGKKVLRPGGKELTLELIGKLDITETDDIAEFAPGLGFTASIALGHRPQSYTGVELNEEVAEKLRKTINGEGRRIITGNAANSNLESDSLDKVYGEAMLSMQADHRKSEIIREASRILKKGGFYGIHELGLSPDNISESDKANILQDVAKSIKVNARPLTSQEWINLIENEGFKVVYIAKRPMHLLEPSRIIDDEGFFRTLKIAFNVLRFPDLRKHILTMRRTFKKHESNLNAIAIVAQKI
ncbi:methyltransferase (plasmid) [Fulvitalea axinellae]|uniref:Methyltransferase n=1 Tax=Fulvitalea axinellae TaxID=1182444 RepID=A0AAU9CZ48_9BACT|nr:methyltransferase [Fulvitalea axinellae]